MIIRNSCVEKRKQTRSEFAELDMLKAEYDMRIANGIINKDTEQLKREIYRIEENLEEELRLKAGIKWREEGERSSKYFMNLIKNRTQLKACINSFLDSNGTLITDIKDCVEHAKNFYINLYSSRENNTIDNEFFAQCPKLEMDDKTALNVNLTVEELYNTLKTCKDSAP